MDDKSAAPEGGFTLVEIVIAVAIVAITVAGGFGISLASRSLAVSTAAGEFDQFLDSARTIARDLDGATLAFTPDAYGDGTEVRLLAGGPNGAPSPTTLPTLHARATIEEIESLGKAPFAFIVHANGSLSGRPGYRVGDTATSDVGCPASGAFHFVIRAAGGSADRYVPCRTKLAASGPVTLSKWPLAPMAPSPTPCSGVGCTATSLPSVPASTPTCPPNFTAAGRGCAPVSSSSGSGARYHVTVAGAPATINVGAAGSFTAQATLTNANAVPAGTPGSIPVGVQSADAACSATPAGWQPSGSAFTVTGTAAGTCMITVQADPSAVPGATADSATLSVTITASANPTPSPTPSACDLVTNGKCYHRIVDQTAQKFSKWVMPDTSCASPNPTCVYVDSIRQIQLEPAYGFRPPIPAIDNAHEILINVAKVIGIISECQPYSFFSDVPAGNTIQWGGSGIGAPVDAVVGYGEPSTYITLNHLSIGLTADGGFVEPNQSWAQNTTARAFFATLTNQRVGLPFSFTFASSADTSENYIQWYPDFPGCDVAGDPTNPGVEYGVVSVELVFEIYQAAQ